MDTCIECDHLYFDGFLKVSLEEVIIALRDEKHLLIPMKEGDEMDLQGLPSLYPDGFSLARFVELVGNSEIWK